MTHAEAGTGALNNASTGIRMFKDLKTLWFLSK
jgi:hypothetical protein